MCQGLKAGRALAMDEFLAAGESVFPNRLSRASCAAIVKTVALSFELLELMPLQFFGTELQFAVSRNDFP